MTSTQQPDDTETQREDPQQFIGIIVGGRYRLESFLSQGGMGYIFKATDLSESQVCVVKMLRKVAIRGNLETILARLKREAKITFGLRHPGIVRLFDYNLDVQRPYLVMEYITGESLDLILSRFPKGLPLVVFSAIMESLCQIVEALHAEGVVHRDLKPANIMFDQHVDPPQVKLLDFGLVHPMEQRLDDSDQHELTRPGEMVGSLGYMSPEQCLGDAINQQTDVYGLGLVAYELLTGQAAISGEGFMETMQRQLKERPTPIPAFRDDVPPTLAFAVYHALEKQPKARPESAAAFWQELAAGLEDIGTPPPDSASYNQVKPEPSIWQKMKGWFNPTEADKTKPGEDT